MKPSINCTTYLTISNNETIDTCTLISRQPVTTIFVRLVFLITPDNNLSSTLRQLRSSVLNSLITFLLRDFLTNQRKVSFQWLKVIKEIPFISFFQSRLPTTVYLPQINNVFWPNRRRRKITPNFYNLCVLCSLLKGCNILWSTRHTTNLSAIGTDK